MKILSFVADTDGCYHYRNMQPLNALMETGRYDVTMFDEQRFQESGFPRLGSFDVLFLQRQTSPKVLAYAESHKAHGGHIVFEIDDDFWKMPQRNHSRAYYYGGSEHLKTAEKILGISDAAIVSTDRLADQVRKFCPNVFVAHNCLDARWMNQFAQKGEFETPSSVVIGWAGSPTHEEDFAPIVPAIMAVMKARPDTRMEFVGGDYRGMFPISVRMRMKFLGGTKGHGVRYPSTFGYYEMLGKANWHLAIAPVQSLTFNASKSYIKVLEYGMMGFPCVASDFGPYKEYASGWTISPVKLAGTPKEWTSAMLGFIDSPALRQTYRETNRAYINARHLVGQRLPEWEAAFESLRSAVPA